MHEIVLDLPAAVACPAQTFNLAVVITTNSAHGWWWSGEDYYDCSLAIDAARRTGWAIFGRLGQTPPTDPAMQMIEAAQASLKEEQDV